MGTVGMTMGSSLDGKDRAVLGPRRHGKTGVLRTRPRYEAADVHCPDRRIRERERNPGLERDTPWLGCQEEKWGSVSENPSPRAGL